MKRIKASKELIQPKVLNKYTDAEEIKTYTPDQIMYIGRGSKWGNPFAIGEDGDREEVIVKYSEWLMTQPQLLDSLDELKGKHLICYCAPKMCHGDILLTISNPIKNFKLKEKKIKRVTITNTIGMETLEKALTSDKGIETIQRVISRVRPKSTGETISVRTNIHGKPHTRYPEEKVIEVPKEDENAALELAINKSGNWSSKDKLWHMGSPLYSKETFVQSNDRMRLYYEWKYSYPSEDDWLGLKDNSMSGFFAGFVAGIAYAKEQITTEQIDNWKKERAKYMKLEKQDHSFYDNDIPF